MARNAKLSMTSPTRIVFASGNAGKVREIKAMLGDAVENSATAATAMTQERRLVAHVVNGKHELQVLGTLSDIVHF